VSSKGCVLLERRCHARKLYAEALRADPHGRGLPFDGGDAAATEHPCVPESSLAELLAHFRANGPPGKRADGQCRGQQTGCCR
jgi:hypothetical protein